MGVPNYLQILNYFEFQTIYKSPQAAAVAHDNMAGRGGWWYSAAYSASNQMPVHAFEKLAVNVRTYAQW